MQHRWLSWVFNVSHMNDITDSEIIFRGGKIKAETKSLRKVSLFTALWQQLQMCESVCFINIGGARERDCGRDGRSSLSVWFIHNWFIHFLWRKRAQAARYWSCWLISVNKGPLTNIVLMFICSVVLKCQCKMETKNCDGEIIFKITSLFPWHKGTI